MDQPGLRRQVWALERSEHLILLSFRIIATGRGRCPALRGAFVRFFGDLADEALVSVHDAVAMIGAHGRRRLQIHAPGCLYSTPDETALMATFAAAQEAERLGEDARLRAHLHWLMAGKPGGDVLRAVQTATANFTLCGLDLPVHEDVIDFSPGAASYVVH